MSLENNFVSDKIWERLSTSESINTSPLHCYLKTSFLLHAYQKEEILPDRKGNMITCQQQ